MCLFRSVCLVAHLYKGQVWLACPRMISNDKAGMAHIIRTDAQSLQLDLFVSAEEVAGRVNQECDTPHLLLLLLNHFRLNPAEHWTEASKLICQQLKTPHSIPTPLPTSTLIAPTPSIGFGGGNFQFTHDAFQSLKFDKAG